MKVENLKNQHQKNLYSHAQDFFSEWSKKELIEKILEDMTFEQAQNLYESYHEETAEESYDRVAEEQFESMRDSRFD